MEEVALTWDSEVVGEGERPKTRMSDKSEGPAAGRHRAKAGNSHVPLPLWEGEVVKSIVP